MPARSGADEHDEVVRASDGLAGHGQGDQCTGDARIQRLLDGLSSRE